MIFTRRTFLGFVAAVMLVPARILRVPEDPACLEEDGWFSPVFTIVAVDEDTKTVDMEVRHIPWSQIKPERSDVP